MADRVHGIWCSFADCLRRPRFAVGYPTTGDNLLCRRHAREVRAEQEARKMNELLEATDHGPAPS